MIDPEGDVAQQLRLFRTKSGELSAHLVPNVIVCGEQADTMDVTAILIGLVIAGIGIAGVFTGAKSLRRWQQVSADDPVSIRDAITESGTVEIEGDVRPHDSTLESAHFEKECVAYEYKIERRRSRSSKSGSNSSWQTVDSGQASRPFIVEDESERAYVDPDGASFSLESERTRKTDAQGKPIPDDSRLNVSVSANIPGMGNVGIGNRRYTVVVHRRFRYALSW